MEVIFKLTNPIFSRRKPFFRIHDDKSKASQSKAQSIIKTDGKHLYRDLLFFNLVYGLNKDREQFAKRECFEHKSERKIGTNDIGIGIDKGHLFVRLYFI